MAQEIRLWEVTPERTLVEVAPSEINREEELEDWLESNISMLDPDLLVIGRQVRTDFHGAIDLLCIDRAGSMVVVELKKAQARREVTAQVLDDASWVKGLGAEEIADIAASKHDGDEGWLATAFLEKFDEELPTSLNVDHRSLIVAEYMDDDAERIVTYLSDMNVPINMVTVQHFKDRNGREMLAQVFLVEPEQAKEASKSKLSTRPRVDDLFKMAEDSGIGHLFERLREGVRRVLSAYPYPESMLYQCRTREGKLRAILEVNASRSDNEGMGFTAHATRFGEHLGIDLDRLKALLPTNVQETTSVRQWRGSSDEEKANAVSLEGDFHTVEEVDKFVKGLRQAVVQSAKTV